VRQGRVDWQFGCGMPETLFRLAERRANFLNDFASNDDIYCTIVKTITCHAYDNILSNG
jgi:hypothetical protein